MRRGFTLIELLVVMAIIATLLTIAAPRYFSHLNRAREATLRQTLVVTRDAIDKFHADTGRYPNDLAELVSKRYLRALPIDPITESPETWVIVEPPNEAAGVYDLHSGASEEGDRYATW
jgi:general secretion pathway protein G